MLYTRLTLCLFAFLFTTRSLACENGSLAEMADTWKKFRKMSLTGTAQQISEFHQFPFKMTPPDKGSPPFKITKNIFLKNYKTLFREAVPRQENEIFTELKSTTDDSYQQTTWQEFDKSGCNRLGSAQVFSYVFTWKKDAHRWVITNVYTADYPILESVFKYGFIKK